MLDGFPRTLQQARMLDETLSEMGMGLNVVLNLDVPHHVILQRIQDRWIHASSGRVYNYSFNPPKIEGRDDITSEPLSKRSDDNVVKLILLILESISNPIDKVSGRNATVAELLREKRKPCKFHWRNLGRNNSKYFRTP